MHGGVQAGDCRALQKVRDDLRGGGARAGLRRRGLSDWVKKADAADCGTGGSPFQMAEGLRRFSADGPNMARFADITCVKTRQGRLHPAPAMGI